jgi:hypothetical protein
MNNSANPSIINDVVAAADSNGKSENSARDSDGTVGASQQDRQQQWELVTMPSALKKRENDSGELAAVAVGYSADGGDDHKKEEVATKLASPPAVEKTEVTGGRVGASPLTKNEDDDDDDDSDDEGPHYTFHLRAEKVC